MKKIIAFLFIVVSSCICNAQEDNTNFTFITVIASPWGVANSVTADGADVSKVNTLDFLPSTGKSGTIRVTDANASLSSVTLQAGSTLSDKTDSAMTWDVEGINDDVSVYYNGTIRVKQLGMSVESPNPSVDFNNTSSHVLKVGTLTLNGGANAAFLSTGAVKKLGSDSYWYQSKNDEPTDTLQWCKWSSSNKNACGLKVEGSTLSDGDYILMSPS